jgi:diacylglycerol kinase
MSKLQHSFGYAIKGILVAFKEQRNLKVHTAIAIIVIVAGFYFSVQSWEWVVLLLCIGIVISLELMNSAIENLVDLVTQERKPLAGKVKDIAAGAVLVVSIAALIIGVIIFLPHLK